MPENSLKLRARVAATLAALTFLVTGCSELPADAPTTPVSYRACLITEAATDAPGLNDLADYAIKQAVVTYGIQRTAAKSKVANFSANVKTLTKQGCKLFVVSGQGFAPNLKTVANGAPGANFVFLTEALVPDLVNADLPNLSVYRVDLFEVGLLSGYIGASISKTHLLTEACAAGSGDDFLMGVRSGALHFDMAGNTNTSVSSDASLAGTQADVVLTAGCPSTYTPVNLDAAAVETSFIGYGRDIYSKPNFLADQSRVATTVIPQVAPRLLEVIASDLEGDFIGGAMGSTTALYGNQGLQLAPNHELQISDTTINELQSVSANYEAGLK